MAPPPRGTNFGYDRVSPKMMALRKSRPGLSVDTSLGVCTLPAVVDEKSARKNRPRGRALSLSVCVYGIYLSINPSIHLSIYLLRRSSVPSAMLVPAKRASTGAVGSWCVVYTETRSRFESSFLPAHRMYLRVCGRKQRRRRKGGGEGGRAGSCGQRGCNGATWDLGPVSS